MRLAWIALLPMISYGVLADSQPPVPTPSKPAQINQRGTEHKDDYAAPTNELSENGAPPSHFQVSRQVNQPYAANHSNDGNENSLEKWWSVGVVPGLTLMLLSVQAWIYWRQRELMAAQAAIMKSTLETNVKALKVTQDAVGIAGYQAEELRKAEIRQHPPRLKVRNVVVMPPIFDKGKPIRGKFYVSNIGGSRTFINVSHCEVLWNVNSLPMESPYEGKKGNNPIIAPTELAAGASCQGFFESEAPYPFDKSRMPGDIGINGVRIYILGWIEYSDDLPIHRRVAFCRQFGQRDGSARFYPTDDPDYEYEE